MPSLLIRNIDDALYERLKDSAASHRRSLEDEARELLRASLTQPEQYKDESVADIVERLFCAETDDFELELPPRRMTPKRPPPFADES